MRRIAVSLALVSLLASFSGCHSSTSTTPAPAASSAAKLGIRPHGDETIQWDQAKLTPVEKQTFDYIDSHIDEHVANLQSWVRQPSISNSGEGIAESAEMVKG